MSENTFHKKLRKVEKKLDKALFFDESGFLSGKSSRAFWDFASCMINEMFAGINVSGQAERVSGSGKEVIKDIKSAEKHISRGIRTLALLLADPSIREQIDEELRNKELIHPWNSYKGTTIRQDPALSRRLGRFMDKQIERGKSLEQFKEDARLFINQMNIK
ncbi:MAG: hypothetical protein FVQ80_13720 [Planctomycetes bacterium]|nr:hypothetical protein [Planctomycetota bacterium]